MSRGARVKDEPGGEVTEQAHIKAEVDWSEWAVGVKQEPAEEPEDSPLSDTAEAPCTAAPCAGYCRRGALHDHTYATPAPGGARADECGKLEVGPARAWPALYAGHVVKDELVLGPERVQRPPAAPQAASERASAAVTKPARKPRARLALKKCSVRLKRAPRCGPRARARGSDCDPATLARGDSDSEDKTYEYATVDYDKDPTCDMCGRRFTAKSDLVNHVAVHIHVEEDSDDLPQYLWRWAQLAPRDCRVLLERCAPPRPPRGQDAAPRRKRAVADALLAANIYVCDICEETFNRKRSLISHIKMHTEKYESPNMSRVIHKRNYAADGRYSCKCKKEFNMLKHLLIHIRIRKGGKAYSCAICKKMFLLRTELKNHTLIHTREQPFSCEICQRKFRQLSSLKRHKSIVHSECEIQKNNSESAKVKCEICNKRFADLKTHKLVHTGEKPYSCEVCGKGFTQSSTLTAHSRIHTGEKPYPCKMCKRRFRRLNDLYRHNRIHTGEMPHPCEICGEQFRRLYWLTEHLRFHTGEKQVLKSGRTRKRSTSPLSNCGRSESGIRPRERIRLECAGDDIHREDVRDDVNMNEEVTNMYVHISGKGERQRWRRVEADLSSSSLS